MGHRLAGPAPGTDSAEDAGRPNEGRGAGVSDVGGVVGTAERSFSLPVRQRTAAQVTSRALSRARICIGTCVLLASCTIIDVMRTACAC